MPRKRHDTSSEDSGSSDEEVRSRKRGNRSQQDGDHNSEQYSSSSPQKGSRGNKNARKKADSDPYSSPDSAANRSRDRQQYSSDSDASPMKRSVVSKVEKPNPSGRGRDSRGLDNRSRIDRDERRSLRSSNLGQKSEWKNDHYEASGGRMSPDRRQRRNSLSPERQQYDIVSRNRNETRSDARRRSVSPDRSARFGSRRNDNQGLRSPNRGQGWRGQPIRGPGYRNDQQSFDRQSDSRFQNRGQDKDFPDRNRGQNRDFPDRNRPNRDRSRSVDKNRTRNDSEVGYDKRNYSPEQLRSNESQGRQRSVSPVRSSRGQTSLSPARSGRISQQGSVAGQNSPTKSKSKSGKKLKDNTNIDKSYIDSDEEIDKASDISKRSKKKKKKGTEKDDSLERSFERSKQLLEESTHSKDFDIPGQDNSIQELSPSKDRKKTKLKRQREHSESEHEMLLKKTKRSKGGEESSKASKKAQKKAKKKVPVSRSPSPNGRMSEKKKSKSFDRYKSRSSDRSFGRSHDMEQFESEPESGEITDSEEEAASQRRQSMRSLINKPTGEEDPQSLEEERYLNKKRKASRMKEREDSEKREDSKKESGKERGSKRKGEEPKPAEPESAPESKKTKTADPGVEAFTGRTGGAYIPPARLRAMQAKITDKSSVEYQRISWEALKKSINGLVNKVNVGNIENIVRELFQENIVRGRGLMARSIIQAQAASPTFTHVYAALVAIVNTKFPQNGELILRRLIIQFRRGYKRNDKSICLSSTRFIAHLVNQQVAHEVLALEILTLLLETPTDDSVEVAIGFLKECGQKLTELTPRGINGIVLQIS